MSQLHVPTLLIGLGGTGITALRFLHASAEIDADLGHALECGIVGSFGIDADPDANKPQQDIDQAIFDLCGDGPRDPLFGRTNLPPLDHFFSLNAEQIVTVVRRVEADARLRRAAGGTMPDGRRVTHPEIDAWFPWQTSDAGPMVQPTLGEANGAQQYRPLGRAGLFANLPELYHELKGRIASLEGVECPASVRRRVVIVASLAGGTGAGLFWDVAFLTRAISQDVAIHGYFMLADISAGAQATARTGPNCYASLMELAAYATWADAPGGYRVDYPGLAPFQGGPTAGPAFNLVRVFGARTVPKSRPKDPVRVTMQASALTVARTIAAAARLDVTSAGRHTQQNGASPNRDGTDHEERRHVFGTSGTVLLPIVSQPDAAKLVAEWLELSLAPGIAKYGEEATVSKDGIFALEVDATASPAGTGATPDLSRILSVLHQPRAPNAGEQDDGSLFDPPEPFGAEAPGELLPARLRRVIDAILAESERVLGMPAIAPDDVLGLLAAFATRIGPDCDALMPTTTRRGQDKPILVQIVLALSEHGIETNEEDRQRTLRQSLNDLQWSPDSVFEATAIRAKAKLDKDLSELTSGLARGPLGVSKRTDLQRMWAALDDQKWHRLPFAFGKADIAEQWGKLHGSLFLKDRNRQRPLLGRWLDHIDRRVTYADALRDLARMLVGLYARTHDEISELIHARFRDDANVRRLIQEVLENDNAHRAHWAGLAASLAVSDGFSTVQRRRDDLARKLRGLIPVFQEMAGLFKQMDRADAEGQGSNWDDIMNGVALMDSFKKIVSVVEEIRGGKSGVEASLRDAWGRMARQFSEGVDRDVREIGAILTSCFQTAIELEPVHIIRLMAGKEAPGAEKMRALCLHFAKAFLEIPMAEPRIAIARFGGEEGLTAAMRRALPDTFLGGAQAAPLAIREVIMVPPKDISEHSGKAFDELRKAMHNRSQQVFNRVPVYADASGAPLIHYETLYNPGSALRHIQTWHNEYITLSIGQRRTHHFHRDAVRLPPLVDSLFLDKVLTCGNVGCTVDIRYTSRRNLFCPGCAKPILNRCGNQECHSDTVLEEVKDAAGAEPIDTVANCPTCANPLRTYWWCCEDTDHANRLIALDKTECPLCVREVNDRRRRPRNIHGRPSDTFLPCPGCRPPAGSKHAIPGELVPYYRNGVNGGKHREFDPLVAKHKRDRFVCDNVRPAIHFIFPTCPEGQNDPARRHHLYRFSPDGVAPDLGCFVCGTHPNILFRTCGNCEYPIRFEDQDQNNEASKPCPRCRQSVRWCFSCSDRDETLFTPVSSSPDGTEICPRCDFPMAKSPPPMNSGASGAE